MKLASTLVKMHEADEPKADKIKVVDLRKKLEEKEESIKVDEIDKIENEITALEAKLKELNKKHENELKLKYVLDKESRNLGSKVFAKPEQVEFTNELLELKPEEIPAFEKKHGYGFGNGWKR